MQTLGRLPTIPYFICLKNHSQLDLLSPSTNAKGKWKYSPLYLPVKKVTSTQSNGRQCRKDSMHVPKLKNARWNFMILFTSGSLSLNVVYVSGLFCFITSS